MPPALVDEDTTPSASDLDEIPYRHRPEKLAKEEEEEVEAEDEEETDDDDEGEEEYVVEKIMGHRFDDDGTLFLEVKWQGYEKKADRTWEPEENLDGAPEVLQEYFGRLGGRPEPGDETKPKKGKRKQSSVGSAAETKAGPGRGRKKAKVENGNEDDAGRKGKGSKKWEPPKGLWENDILNIDCIEEEYDEANKQNKRVGYVMWSNGKKSKHSLKILNGKCPQKLLEYYEQHLVFRNSSSKPAANGADQNNGEARDGADVAKLEDQ